MTYFRYKLYGGIRAEAWVSPSLLGISNRNFGDDINKPILETFSGQRVLFTSQLPKMPGTHILPIGSILGIWGDEKSVVWGSGFLYEDKPLKALPHRICAVRGKLTYQYLLDHNIPCPPIFGDPALLLPYIYKSEKYGIIPHIRELEQPHVRKFVKDNTNVLLIELQNYKSWQDVIDKICSCDRILSSSLHGIIVSDAYHIPNVFVHFSDLVNGGEFKYRDYMSAVDRKYIEPFYFYETIKTDLLDSLFEQYLDINFDPLPLLESYPYKKSLFLQRLIEDIKVKEKYGTTYIGDNPRL